MNAAADKVDHGQANAKGWTETICELVAALECDYDRLEELRDEREALTEALADASHDDNGNTVNSQDADDALKALNEWDESNVEELRDLTESATLEGELQSDAEAVRERIIESPLSVQVRGDWYSPGTMEKPDASEFEILLSTGGPALRIRGELDQHMQPSRAWLEYQDWGTGWIQYFEVEQETLLSFSSCFYFGE